MNNTIGQTLAGFKTGRLQAHLNMAAVPLTFGPKHKKGNGEGPAYLTMKEALDGGFFVVTEVSEGGSVPNLKVANKGDAPVLLLDGEEVAGAKQNRVLNTTILVGGKSEVVIPVSCTEQGRWSYASHAFYESGNMMESMARRVKHQSVNASYLSFREARSNQGEVWDNIASLSSRAGVSSGTGAMRDVYEQRKEDLDAYLKAFTCIPGQKGIVIFIGRKLIGFDYLSSDKAFAGLFPKIVKSYAMEAWVGQRDAERRARKGQNAEAAKEGARAKGKGADKAGKKGGAGNGQAMTKAAALKEVNAFFEQASGCEEKSYDSVGLGRDFRYGGPGMVGSSLLVEEAVIHMAFFRLTESEKAGNMAGPSRRRSFII